MPLDMLGDNSPVIYIEVSLSSLLEFTSHALTIHVVLLYRLLLGIMRVLLLPSFPILACLLSDLHPYLLMIIHDNNDDDDGAANIFSFSFSFSFSYVPTPFPP